MAATASRQPPPVDEVLAREAAGRRRAGLAAVLGGLLTFVSSIAAGVVYSDYPQVPVFDALREAAGQRAGQPGLRTPQMLWLDDHSLDLILVALAVGLGVLATAYALAFLFEAARARRPELPRFIRWAIWIGGIATALATIALQVFVAVRTADFAASADQSTAAAHDVLRSAAVNVFESVRTLLGQLPLAMGLLFVSLNAMRVGLLTRFMGILGVIAAVLMVLPLFPQQIVLVVWLVSVGALMLGRYPGGAPKAWETGKAEPWPTQLELREQREREMQRRRRERGGEELESPEAPRTETPSPATSQRKKRKRRQ